jgi:hypothetical protein
MGTAMAPDRDGDHLLTLGDGQDHEHQHERDRDLRAQGHQGSGWPRPRDRVVDGGMRHRRAEPGPVREDSGHALDELGSGVPPRHLPEAPEGQGHRRVEAGAGPATPNSRAAAWTGLCAGLLVATWITFRQA